MKPSRDPSAVLATVRDAATALAVSEDKVRRLMREKHLPTVRILGSVRTTWAAIDAMATPTAPASTPVNA